MLANITRTVPRSIDEVTRLIEVYPERWRRWCSGPESARETSDSCGDGPRWLRRPGNEHSWAKLVRAYSSKK